MKHLLVRANKYIDDNKLKSSATNADMDAMKHKLIGIRDILMERWTINVNHSNNVNDSINTSIDDMVSELMSDDISLDVDRCHVLCRVQYNNMIWCLCSTNQQQQVFWTTQHTFIRKKMQARQLTLTRLNGTDNNNDSHATSDINNTIELYVNELDEIRLYDGTILPPTIDQQLRIELHDKFSEQFAHAHDIASNEVNELKHRVTSLNDKLSDIQQEYQRYKVNAQQLLHSQSIELQQNELHAVQYAQLQSDNQHLQHQIKQLMAQQSVNEPDQLQKLQIELSHYRTQLDQLHDQLQSMEAKYVHKLQLADEDASQLKREYQHNLSQLNNELTRVRHQASQQIQLQTQKHDALIHSKQEQIDELMSRMEQLQQNAHIFDSTDHTDTQHFNEYIAATASNRSDDYGDMHTPTQQYNHQSTHDNGTLVHTLDMMTHTHHGTNSVTNGNVNDTDVMQHNESNRLQQQLRQLHDMLAQSELQVQSSRSAEHKLVQRIHELERELGRCKELGATSNIQYLKNVMVSYMSTNREIEHDALLPVLFTLLRLGPDEIDDIKSKRIQSSNVASKLLSNLF